MLFQLLCRNLQAVGDLDVSVNVPLQGKLLAATVDAATVVLLLGVDD